MKTKENPTTADRVAAIKLQPAKTDFGNFLKNYQLYLLFLPGLLMLLVFRYVPIYGLVIAFKEFNMFTGISKSPWVGFLQFERLFRSSAFLKVLGNTLYISFAKLLLGFPAPILLALMLNELKNGKFKKIAQTVMYLPHFISWVIFSGIIMAFLNPVDGLFNIILKNTGGKTIFFLGQNNYFPSVVILTDIFKEIGWGTIVYLAAMAGIDPSLYEAAEMDGASRIQQAVHITLPSIAGVIVVLFILRMGGIMEAGFQQILMLYNPLVYETGDVISTYVYRRGIVNSQFSFGAAAGMFQSLVALVLIFITNKMAKRLGQEGLW